MVSESQRRSLRQTSEEIYVFPYGFTMQREYGTTPNENPIAGRWVLRKEGCFVDFDKYRFDLAERNGLKIEDAPVSISETISLCNHFSHRDVRYELVKMEETQ